MTGAMEADRILVRSRGEIPIGLRSAESLQSFSAGFIVVAGWRLRAWGR